MTPHPRTRTQLPKRTVSIIGTGSYLPEKVLTNAELEKSVETSDEWITSRTGIRERRIAAEGEFTSDLAAKAAQSALENAGIGAEEIDLIIIATITPDHFMPSTACIVQTKIGAKRAACFDISAACSGFLYAVEIAQQFITSHTYNTILVVGADKLSSIVNWTDRNTCVLFGDGAGAVILQATEDQNPNEKRGIIASSLYSDGTLNDILKTSGGVALNQKTGFIEMSGKEVFKHAVDKMVKSVIATLAKAGLTTKDIDLLVPHQANLRILNAVATRLELPEEKVIVTVQKHANTSAASIPLALDHANSQGKIKDGDVVVLEALGGGLTWGSVVLKW